MASPSLSREFYQHLDIMRSFFWGGLIKDKRLFRLIEDSLSQGIINPGDCFVFDAIQNLPEAFANAMKNAIFSECTLEWPYDLELSKDRIPEQFATGTSRLSISSSHAICYETDKKPSISELFKVVTSLVIRGESAEFNAPNIGGLGSVTHLGLCFKEDCGVGYYDPEDNLTGWEHVWEQCAGVTSLRLDVLNAYASTLSSSLLSSFQMKKIAFLRTSMPVLNGLFVSEDLAPEHLYVECSEIMGDHLYLFDGKQMPNALLRNLQRLSIDVRCSDIDKLLNFIGNCTGIAQLDVRLRSDGNGTQLSGQEFFRRLCEETSSGRFINLKKVNAAYDAHPWHKQKDGCLGCNNIAARLAAQRTTRSQINVADSEGDSTGWACASGWADTWASGWDDMVPLADRSPRVDDWDNFRYGTCLDEVEAIKTKFNGSGGIHFSFLDEDDKFCEW